MLSGNVKVDHGGSNRFVPQKHLDFPDIVSHLQKMCGKAMPQGVYAFAFFNSRLVLRIPVYSLGCGSAYVFLRVFGREQPNPGTVRLVITTQLL